MQVKEPTFSVSNMFTFNSQQYFKYFDFLNPAEMHFELYVYHNMYIHVGTCVYA